LRAHLRTFTREEDGARCGEVEGVHRFRVGTRRLRAALRLLGSFLPAKEAARATRSLQWLGQAIGQVRDLDVLKLAVSTESRGLDPELRVALRPLHRAIAERRASALALMIRALNSPRYRDALLLFDGLTVAEAHARAAATIGERAPELVRPVWSAVVRARRRLDAEESAENYHRLRVSVKRLRYTLESLQTLGAKRVRRTIEQLVAVQDVLGAHQDAVTQIAWLRAYADGAAVPPVTLLATGALMQALARRARRCRARLPQRWKGLAKRGLQRKVLAELSHPPQQVRPVRLLQRAS
jgi:CHAD domain-containing protein